MLALILIIQLIIAGFIILGFRLNLNLGYLLTALAVFMTFTILRTIIPLMIFQFGIIYFAMKVGRNLNKQFEN